VAKAPWVLLCEAHKSKEINKMTTKFITAFLVFALAVASAATYSVTIYQPAVVQGKDLKAGEYKVVVEGNKVVLSMGKEKLEATVKTEENSQKYSSTTVRYASEGGKSIVQEIRLGGTKTKLVFN
jgi:roadblock/LC7 domain-containing protein